MRGYRCSSCDCEFVILTTLTIKSGKGVTCPLCAGKKVAVIDTVKEIGGRVATAVSKWWGGRGERE